MSINRSISLQKAGAVALHGLGVSLRSVRSTSPAVTNTPEGRTPCTPSTAGNGPSGVGKYPGHEGPKVQTASAKAAGVQSITARKGNRPREREIFIATSLTRDSMLPGDEILCSWRLRKSSRPDSRIAEYLAGQLGAPIA